MNLEPVRRRARRVLGYRSTPYRAAQRALVLAELLRREGLRGWGILKTVAGPDASPKTLQLRSLRYPFTLRPGTDDVSALVNNVIREEYGQLGCAFSPQTVVDVGAYIGDTAVYFLNRFPGARVIALEPNSESLALARSNLEPYGTRATLVAAALGAESGSVTAQGRQMGAKVVSTETGVPSLTIPELMRKYDIPFIDLLKIDIEGAEISVLRRDKAEWLAKVGILLLETHGTEHETRVLPVLRDEGFRIQRYRNVWYCSRRDYQHQVAV